MSLRNCNKLNFALGLLGFALLLCGSARGQMDRVPDFDSLTAPLDVALADIYHFPKEYKLDFFLSAQHYKKKTHIVVSNTTLLKEIDYSSRAGREKRNKDLDTVKDINEDSAVYNNRFLTHRSHFSKTYLGDINYINCTWTTDSIAYYFLEGNTEVKIWRVTIDSVHSKYDGKDIVFPKQTNTLLVYYYDKDSLLRKVKSVAGLSITTEYVYHKQHGRTYLDSIITHSIGSLDYLRTYRYSHDTSFIYEFDASLKKDQSLFERIIENNTGDSIIVTTEIGDINTRYSFSEHPFKRTCFRSHSEGSFSYQLHEKKNKNTLIVHYSDISTYYRSRGSVKGVSSQNNFIYKVRYNDGLISEIFADSFNTIHPELYNPIHSIVRPIIFIKTYNYINN